MEDQIVEEMTADVFKSLQPGDVLELAPLFPALHPAPLVVTVIDAGPAGIGKDSGYLVSAELSYFGVKIKQITGQTYAGGEVVQWML